MVSSTLRNPPTKLQQLNLQFFCPELQGLLDVCSLKYKKKEKATVRRKQNKTWTSGVKITNQGFVSIGKMCECFRVERLNCIRAGHETLQTIVLQPWSFCLFQVWSLFLYLVNKLRDEQTLWYQRSVYLSTSINQFITNTTQKRFEGSLWVRSIDIMQYKIPPVLYLMFYLHTLKSKRPLNAIQFYLVLHLSGIKCNPRSLMKISKHTWITGENVTVFN